MESKIPLKKKVGKQKEKIGSAKKKWRCGGSNPVPLACKASALPFELHPLCGSSPLKNLLEHKNNIPLTRGIRNVDTN